MVSPFVLSLVSLSRLDVPVAPDADEARRWAAEELAKQAYQDAKPSWLKKVLDLLGQALDELLGSAGSPNGNVGLAIVIGLVLVAVLVIILVVRPRLKHRKAAKDTVFAADKTLSANQHRNLAKAAAQAGDFHTAITEQFRALARSGEERDVTASTPGRTAAEISADLANAFPDCATGINRAATLFNAVRYGKVPPTQPMYEELLATDTAVSQATPDYADDFLAVSP